MRRQAGWLTAAALLCGLAVGWLVVRGQRGGPKTADDEPPGGKTRSAVEMILIPAGSFQMGTEQSEEIDESPHKVYVSSFLIDKYEVSQAEFASVMGKNPSRWKAPKSPAEQIRWSVAARYCNARSRMEGLQPAYNLETWECDFEADGYRLPTEAEWEYAARAGTETQYHFGDSSSNLKDYAWFKENCTRKPRQVGKRMPNGWGLHDMYGNVWEWCNDFYAEDYYQGSPEKDPRGPASGETRVVRGGSWSSRADKCRSAYRDSEDPGYTDVCFGADRRGFYGFRCVRNAPAAE